MRVNVLAGLLVASAVWVVWDAANPRRVEAVPAVPGVSGELITLSTPLGDLGQQLIVIDPKLRSMSVYHVQGATGEVSLKSVRNFHWDLQLSHFNNIGLTPPEIRSLLEQPNTTGQ